MPFKPYNSKLTAFARNLRKNMTLAEVLLWKKINRRQLGVRFSRQTPIGEWIVDFYCKELQLAIEVDGDSHNLKKDRDEERQRKLEKMGVRFLRFWDYEVKKDMQSVVNRIDDWIAKNPPRPSATPPKEGNCKNRARHEKLPSTEGVDREAGRGGFPCPEKVDSRQPIKINPLATRHLPPATGRRGAALVVVMWVLLIVSMIVASFAFEMNLETRILSAQRKRFKADQLALAGMEMMRALVDFEEEDPTLEDVYYEDAFRSRAVQLTDGNPVDYSEELGDGTVELHIDFERGKRNVHEMSDDEWKELFEQTGVPNIEWDPLLACLTDWEDENDLHQLNGAESDDPYYRDRGYECKNAPIDTIDELLLIKGWTEDILYGTPPDAEEPMSGIADKLTVWGDGKINPNSASREVFYSLGLSEEDIENTIEMRMGPDGEPNTEDDGIDQELMNALGLDADLYTLVPEYLSVTSIGRVGDLESRISATFQLVGKELKPLFWLEGKIEKEPAPGL